MSKQTLVIALLAAALLFLAGATPSVSAQGPTMVLDNQVHTIYPGTTQWYSFNRADDRTNVLLTLVNGVNLGLAFSVFAPDKNDLPIGRGSIANVPCHNNADKCPSSDLTWSGGASSPGTWVVQVISNNPVVTTFLLTLAGGGATPTPGPIYYYPPYGAPYAPPYVPPYYGAPYSPQYVPPVAQPYSPQYVAPVAPPYYSPGYVPSNIPYCPGGYNPWPNGNNQWYCR
jgi:hypothetical protein